MQPIVSALAYAIESAGDLAMILWRFPSTIWLVGESVLLVVLVFLTARITWRLAKRRYDVPRVRKLTSLVVRERARHRVAERELIAKASFYQNVATGKVILEMKELEEQTVMLALARGPRSVV